MILPKCMVEMTTIDAGSRGRGTMSTEYRSRGEDVKVRRVHANTNSDADVSPRGPTPPSRRVHRDALQQHILEDAGGVRVRRVEQRRADDAVSCVDDAKYCAAASHRPEIQHEQQCPVARILLPCHLE